MELIDVGANLGHASFRHDLDAVLERAAAAGVVQLVVTGTGAAESQEACELARVHRGRLFATAGMHPHLASQWDAATGELFATLAGQPEVVALGECGLDFNRDYSPRPQQEYAFEAQLDLAAALAMPVFLHQRDAHGRFMAILERYLARLPRAVVHCFTGTAEELEAYRDHDLYVGITGWICDERRGSHLCELAGRIPENRLLLETDSPYLLPRTLQPKPKTRRNEPMHLAEVLRVVAECRDVPVQALAAATTANARRFFALPQAPTRAP